MNLLEQYIEEIIGVEKYEAEWTRRFPDREFVEVDMITNCYGNKTRRKHVFNTTEWETYKKQGYYMA